MSVLTYGGPRRFSRPTSARTFPQTYYNERHAPIDYARADPYALPMGGPVSPLRTRSHVDRDEFQPEQGGARRRIAVACARCRKRKIRCSGDKGDGQGCQNCKAAGVETNQCQFHRVGSDHVQKVMDNYNMAQSLASLATPQDMMPLYSIGGPGPHHRSIHNQQYPQLETKFAYPELDAKSAYASDWTTPYGEDTPLIDNYSFEQSPTYLPGPTQATGANAYSPHYRWTHPAARSSQPMTGYHSDYGHSYISTGLPYLDTDVRSTPAAEPISPLNMSSLQLTLPERPRQRQLQPTEVPITPRRRLPAPQPNPGHGLHHALDQQQGQRLRSTQTIATPSFSNATPSYTTTGLFAKPLLPWTAANENLMNAVNEAASATMQPPSTVPAATNTADTSPTFLPTTTSADNTSSSADTVPRTALNFGTLPLLDPSIPLTVPTPPAYSNFRESRDLSASETQLSRNGSSSSLYTYDGTSRRPSYAGENTSSSLVSGHRYTPLSQPTDAPPMRNLTQESFETHDVPAHRASTSNLNASF